MRFAFIVLLAVSPQAASPIDEGPPIFRDPPACWNGSQREMNVCAWKELQQAEVAMSKQYQRVSALMKRLDADSLPPNEVIGNFSAYDALERGQFAWLKFREEHCRIFGSGGGSMSPMWVRLCERDATKARTQQLETLMQNPATGNPYFEDQ